MKISDLYQSVTDDIVGALEEGTPPWVKPWRTGNGRHGNLLPVNAATGRNYSGVNVLILWGQREAGGFSRNAWMTFNQARSMNATVRKGEKGTTVVFARPLTIEKDDEEKTIRMLRSFTVFNVGQIDGLPAEEPDPEEPSEARESRAEAFVEATGAALHHGGDSAHYVPARDSIAMPPFRAFVDVGSYYATLLHELGHWSGHKSRLDRDLTGRFGTRSYAAEELVAELTAAFLCAQLGITSELRHASYIEHWIELMQDDNRAIFTAAAKASQAAEFLRAFSEGRQATPV